MSILGRIFSRTGHADYRHGIELFNEGRFAEAADTFSAALQAIDDPTDPHYSLGRFYIAEARVQLGRQLFASDCPKESQVQLRLALEAGYHYPDLYVSLAQACAQLEEWPEACEACRHALLLNPRYVDARAHLAMALISDGQRDVAMTEIEYIVGEGFAVSIDDDDEGAIRSIVDTLREREESEAVVQRALELYRSGDLDQALPALVDAVAARPRYADVRCKLGSLYASRGQFDLARPQLDEAVAINPKYVDAHLHRVRLAIREGRLSDAEEVLTEVQKQKPTDLDSIGLHAYIKLLTGAADDARTLLADLEPNSGELFHLRALLSWTLGDLDAAHHDFLRASAGRCGSARSERDRHWLWVERFETKSERKPQPDTESLGAPVPETAVLLGREAASKGDWVEAANHWTNAISLGDESPATRAWLGEAELILGHETVAAEHLQIALKSQSFGPWWDALGRAFDSQGDARADECYRLAVEAPEPPVSARLRWAATLLSAGKLEEAQAQYAEIRAQHPYHPVARFVLSPEFFIAA